MARQLVTANNMGGYSPVSGGGSTMSDYTSGGGMFGKDKFQSLNLALAMMALKDPENLSTYKGLIDLFGKFEPEEEDKDLTESLSSGASKLDEISSTISTYTGEGKDVSGFLPGIKTKIGKGFSNKGLGALIAPSTETTDLEAAISEYNTRLFDIAGKAFTGPEKELLEGLVLSIKDDEGRLQTKIKRARKMIEDEAKRRGVSIRQLETGTTGTTTGLRPSLGSFLE